MANKDFFLICSVKIRGLKRRFLAFTQGPGGFREVREASRNHFHLSWYLLVPGVTSYDQEPWGGFFFTVHGTLVKTFRPWMNSL